MTRPAIYMAHPLRPTEDQIAACWGLDPVLEVTTVEAAQARAVAAATRANLDRAMRWLAWLRRTFPETTFVAPWIASVLAGDDDSNPAHREAGIVDALAIIPRLDGLVLAGNRISTGMAREHSVSRRTWDLTWMGVEDPPTSMDPCGLPFARLFGAHIFAPGVVQR